MGLLGVLPLRVVGCPLVVAVGRVGMVLVLLPVDRLDGFRRLGIREGFLLLLGWVLIGHEGLYLTLWGLVRVPLCDLVPRGGLVRVACFN